MKEMGRTNFKLEVWALLHINFTVSGMNAKPLYAEQSLSLMKQTISYILHLSMPTKISTSLFFLGISIGLGTQVIPSSVKPPYAFRLKQAMSDLTFQRSTLPRRSHRPSWSIQQTGGSPNPTLTIRTVKEVTERGFQQDRWFEADSCIHEHRTGNGESWG